MEPRLFRLTLRGGRDLFGARRFRPDRGNGIYYDSCWLADAFTAMNYQALAFREISQ